MEKKYSAPRSCKKFKKIWDLFLPQVTDRQNFRDGHLKLLTFYCDLLLEYEHLRQFVNENGYSFSTSGRYGETIREYPEVKILQKTVAEIRQYAKMLDLTLAKDTFVNDDDDDDEWENG